MSYDRSTIPIPDLIGPGRQRLQLGLLCGVLWLSGCASSLARLPTEPFETRLSNAWAHDPLSVGAHLSLTDESTPTLIAEPLLAASTALVVDGPGEQLPPSIAPATELVTVNAVNAPLAALLHALATQTRLQLQVVGAVDAQVSLKLEQQHFSVVLDQLADQAAFSWEIANDTLTIWNGDAYAYSYAIDYLNIDRRTQSSVGLATQVGTINASDGGASSIANSSQTRVENTSEHQFWGSVQADVEKLVSVQRASALQGLSVDNQRRGESSVSLSGTAVSRPEFSINREAGLLNVYAIPAIHRSVKRYLQQLHDSASRQVLIEATVVEVALSDSFEAGVDWQVLANGVNGVSAIQALVGAPFVNGDSVDRVVPPAGLVSLVQQGSQSDVGATLSLLEQFGDVRILSRPRIIALNNQSSVLKVVDNRVYFTVNIERRQTETRDEIVTESEIHTVPVGLVMNVTPQISRSGAVMLNVRPTLSRILGFVNDPNPELAEANVRNGVPEIQVREMESMLLVQSGNMAIIGGLMQDTTEGNDAQLPGLGELPVLKHLFSKRSRQRRRTELLIVLRPTVIVADTPDNGKSMTDSAEAAEREVALGQMIPSPEATACLAESVARRLRVVPLAIRMDFDPGMLIVACENPSDQILVGRLARQLPEGMRVRTLPCHSREIREALDKCYSPDASGGQLVSRCQDHATTLKAIQEQSDLIIRLLDCILLSASRESASDIHLSPQKQTLHIRFRIDGVLRSFASLDKSVYSGLLVRIKILASMDIAETRCPQDGQFSQMIDADDIDFRVSCFPTVSGQNTVLRLLDKKYKLDTLRQLNLPADTYYCLRALVQRPDGLLLVCGPTGSGKSTTLHALLDVRDAALLNIMTLEDPVERSIDAIRQSSIDASNAMDFSQGVRALLRQDPDVLLIGEIRDTPSCAMALRAVMSGHQVLTTVHARSVLAGLSRLRELGSLPSILANNLVAIASQRLVRKRCLTCLGREGTCSQCQSTGYRGRQLVLELLVVTPALAQLIAAEATHQELLECALQEGFVPLREQGLKLVARGVTTMDELDRVFGRAL